MADGCFDGWLNGLSFAIGNQEKRKARIKIRDRCMMRVSIGVSHGKQKKTGFVITLVMAFYQQQNDEQKDKKKGVAQGSSLQATDILPYV